MVKFTAEQADAILAEARARAEGGGDSKASKGDANASPTNDDPIALDNAAKAAFARHQAKQAVALPEIIYKTVVQPHTQAAPIDWAAVIDAKIAEERAFLIEVVGESLGEALDKERQAAKNDLADEVRRLRIELAETQTTLAELRMVLAAERAKVLDLPNVLGARQRMQ